MQIAAVIILSIGAVFLARKLKYSLLDYYDVWHLQDHSSVWDIYIPVLFFFIQFGCYFSCHFFKQIRLKILKESALRQAALNSETKAIKAQINPHSLYNVFNTINASLLAEQEKTRNMIAQLTDLFRYQLKHLKKNLFQWTKR